MIFIQDIPQMSLNTKTEARRFINLIDTLYDNRVGVVLHYKLCVVIGWFARWGWCVVQHVLLTSYSLQGKMLEQKMQEC